MRRRMTDSLCRCGHPFLSHEHLRRGTECVWCDPGACERFDAPSLVSRVRDRLRSRRSGTGRAGPSLVLVR